MEQKNVSTRALSTRMLKAQDRSTRGLLSRVVLTLLGLCMFSGTAVAQNYYYVQPEMNGWQVGIEAARIRQQREQAQAELQLERERLELQRQMLELQRESLRQPSPVVEPAQTPPDDLACYMAGPHPDYCTSGQSATAVPQVSVDEPPTHITEPTDADRANDRVTAVNVMDGSAERIETPAWATLKTKPGGGK
jgi:hypothetical protein